MPDNVVLPVDTPPVLAVAAGVVIDASGRLLLGQRPEGKAYAGWWELPGGKLEPGETPLQALCRELREELGIEVANAFPWVTHVHVYEHATVRLSFCRVTAWRGDPQGLEGQALAWVDPRLPLAELQAGLGGGKVLPATVPPLRWLNLPDTYAIVGPSQRAAVSAYFAQLDRHLASGVRLLQFRAPEWLEGVADEGLQAVLRATIVRAREAGARVLVNSMHPAAWWAEADGVHWRARDIPASATSLSGLQAASTHDAVELARARAAAVDFVVLGPVLPTLSHPTAVGLGWPAFARLNHEAGLPVYALGGQSVQTRDTARIHGAHGIAGIRL